jgi:hypothetical protein
VRTLGLLLALIAALAAPAGAVALTAFSSPSRNIGCYLARDGVRCDIAKRTWSPPRKPASCHLDYGQGIALTARARFVCAGDTALGAKRTLAYGHTIRAGHYSCTSSATGMTCRNRVTGHGFTLARQRYRIF